MTNRSEEHLHEELKKSEIRAVYVGGMLESNLEQNRHLLFVSVVAIILLTTVFGGCLKTFSSSVFWIFSASCFTASIVATLLFFSQNTLYLRQLLDKNTKSKTQKSHLDFISKVSAISFICGMILLICLVICEKKFNTKKDFEPRDFMQQNYPHQFHPYPRNFEQFGNQMPPMPTHDQKNCQIRKHHHKHQQHEVRPQQPVTKAKL